MILRTRLPFLCNNRYSNLQAIEPVLWSGLCRKMSKVGDTLLFYTNSHAEAIPVATSLTCPRCSRSTR